MGIKVNTCERKISNVQ